MKPVEVLSMIKKAIKRIVFASLPCATVLMFHHIDDGELIVKSGCHLNKSRFIEVLDSGIPFISMVEYAQFPFSKRNPCTITFDDGLKDVYRVAYPELKKRGIPFTIFVVTDFLDQEGYITTDELLELAADPLVTIGSHGVTHEILKEMPQEKQRLELVDSKNRLEELIGRPVRFFAYSHGQFDDATLALLRKEKYYDCAFAAGGGITNWITCKSNYKLPRINCEDGLRTFHIVRKRSGARLVPDV